MDPETWQALKASLLAAGTAQILGSDAGEFLSSSSAGPGAGGQGSVFFSVNGQRVRLSVSGKGPVRLTHLGRGKTILEIEGTGTKVEGELEHPGFHCPRQAFITITGSCIFSCRYCNVPRLKGVRKTQEEIIAMVESVLGSIDAISLTSGILTSIEEEEAYVVDTVRLLVPFGLPIGVSIYPTRNSPSLLKQAGAAEVKFNIEAATDALFAEMCPGLVLDRFREILRDSVDLFGKGHVFSNIILGLGETDAEMENRLEELCSIGVIPVVRPLNPVAELASYHRPDKDRILLLARYDLDTRLALTMCPACMGCDLIPGRE
jgi:biotin synthase-related radical SAM superfamily protein